MAYDWQFAASLPLDQSNMPDTLFNFLPSDVALDNPKSWVNCAVAFYLGDVVENVEAQAMGMKQKFYFAPAALIQRVQPVLNAARDVIRMNIAGQGNSRLFLIPDKQTDCDNYISYLRNRGWWT